MQNRTNSGFSRPLLWQRTRISDARTASRSRAVFALATPVTTPTSRRRHPRRNSHPPIPADTAPMTGAGAYGEGSAIGRGILTVAVGFETPSISRRINVPVAFPRVVLTGTGSTHSGFAACFVSRAVEQCLKSHRRHSDIDGLPIEVGSSPHPRRRLRARETGRRSGPRPHPRRPHARPRGSRQPPAGLSRPLLPGRDERDRDEQSPPAPNPGDESGAVQALRLLRSLARVPAFSRVHRRAGVPRASAPAPRDALRTG